VAKKRKTIGICTVEGCVKSKRSSGAKYCEMHYMRFYRNGTTNKKWVPSERLNHSQGYVIVYAPEHPLTQSNGRIFEHRKVYYDSVSSTVERCSMCEVPISWKTCHIDHINDIKTDNRPENLRATCPKCNRGRGAEKMKRFQRLRGNQLTALGMTLSPAQWVESGLVQVTGATIRRRLKLGMSDFDALFAEKVTHKNG
jgi:hypothetical protein